METNASSKKGKKTELAMEGTLKQIMEMMKGNQERVETKLEDGQSAIGEKLEGHKLAIESVKLEMNSKLAENLESIKELRMDISTVEGRIIETHKTVNEKVKEVEKALREEIEELNRRLDEVQGQFRTSPSPVTSASQPNFQCTVKLSTYDGKTSWEVYKTQLEVVACANCWNDSIKAFQLAAALREEAADILRTLSEDERMNYSALTSALELRFGEQNLKEFYRLQLKTRRQKMGESFQELAADIEKLVQMSYSDCSSDIKNVFALQHFTDAVRDSETQHSLRMSGLKDLKEALAYAMKFESSREASKGEHRIRSAVVEESGATHLKIISQGIEQILQNMQEDKIRTRTRRQPRCYWCGETGHIQRDCWNRDTSRPSNKQRSQREN